MGDPIEYLTAVVDEHLANARLAEHGRSAQLLVHDDALRQSVIALTAGTALDEHNAPLAASLLVLRGRVRLTPASGEGAELSAGELCPLPKERHGLTALEDSAVLLTAVTAV
ncbi:cupin domain-containing protein [Streptomyces apocyni]|uniref:cupin n=1 Tax=Streptomyces apocyni TaxID=2654677 RepID=UPI0012EAA8EA|nr:cupin [Streptomyces apocyni]